MEKSRPQSQTLRYTHVSKNILNADETDLHELATLAGITFDPNVFKIVVELLQMNVAPTAIERMLKSMIQQKYRSQASSESSSDGSKKSSGRSRTERAK